MSVTSTQIINEAYRDLCGMRPGQTTSTDVYDDCLSALNELIDELTQERFFIYEASGAILSAFADLTTAYTLASGQQQFLRKNLATKIAPMMKLYFKIPEPLLEQIETDAARLKMSLRGVGPK